MNVKREFFFQIVIVLVLIASCSAPKKAAIPAAVKKSEMPAVKTSPVLMPAVKTADDIFFEKLYKSDPASFDKIFQHKNDWKVQIIYTEIKRMGKGKSEFTDHNFNKEAAEYFYPASAIKLPLALLALQKINELRERGVYRNTTMLTGSAYSGQTEVYNDPNTPAGKPSIEQYIKRAMLVNDNDACNRLYEFLGQEYINAELKKHGYDDVEILHRVGIDLSDEENRHTNPVSFYDSLNRFLYTQPAQYNKNRYARRNDLVGAGHVSNGKMIKQPMNMSSKNNVSLLNFHTMLKSVFFPGRRAEGTFNITDSDRVFLFSLMGQDPGEASSPFYSGDNYNGYTKYLFYGGEKYRGQSLRSFNTSGAAYGQMTDAALFFNETGKIEFILSATIYCNSDGIINDDKYDYNTVGLPFFKNLGRAVYEYELKKKR